MQLYLCEKPSQARDISRVLGARQKGDGCLMGDDKIVTWCFGHLLEMASPDAYDEAFKRWSFETLPIVPSRWKLEVKKDARKQFKIIQELLKKASSVVIATDADREGETIAREILELCRWQGRIERLWLSALDDSSIRKALDNILPGAKTEPLYYAGLGRARADWLVGMNLTRAYTLIGKQHGHDGVLSVGRVQTPTLNLVVERDLLIEQFKPTAYYELIAEFGTTTGNFNAKWQPPQSVSDTEGRCTNQQAALKVAQRIDARQGTITKATTELKKEPAPLPFDLSSLQQEASRRWGMGAQEVLDTAQALYETHKALTYPRTGISVSRIGAGVGGTDTIRSTIHVTCRQGGQCQTFQGMERQEDHRSPCHHPDSHGHQHRAHEYQRAAAIRSGLPPLYRPVLSRVRIQTDRYHSHRMRRDLQDKRTNTHGAGLALGSGQGRR